MFKLIRETNAIPLARLFAGLMAGKLWLAVWPQDPVDALMIAAWLPIQIGFLTAEYER